MDYTERRHAQGQETERKILQSALALMRGRGFEKVSIRDICHEAGITTGAFYHHFPSKGALLSKGFAPLDDYMEAALRDSQAGEPIQQLWNILEVYAKFMEEKGGELIGRYYQRRMLEPSSQSMDASRYTFRAIVDCFQEAERAGILAAGHTAEWVADFCYRHFRGVVIDWVLHNYSYPLLPRMQEDYALFETLFRKCTQLESAE